MLKKKKCFFVGISFLFAFILWTILVSIIDVKAIGPLNSKVGFATLNNFIHKLVGVNFSLYVITDWLGIIPIIIAFGFAIFGLIQLIKRKSLLNVDFDIIILGLFYLIIIIIYIFFEIVIINYRPTLINGYLEASYPSSTTLLVTTLLPTSILQFSHRIKNKSIKRTIVCIITLFTIFMVIGRIISGVHWITDIIGGLFISTGLVLVYNSICKL